MKPFPNPLFRKFAVFAPIALSFAVPARGDVLSWDGGNTGNSQADGGSGTWNSNATANWWDGAADRSWPDAGENNDAIFANTPGTVEVAAVVANDLTFITSGYILSGAGTLTLNGTTPTLTLGAGVAATIGNNTATILAGSSGLAKAGGGTLNLTGSAANTLTGGVAVSGGTLALNLSNLPTPTNLLDSGNSLTLGGNATLSMAGKPSAVTAQSFSNTSFGDGTNTVALNRGTSTSSTLNLGTVSHTAGEHRLHRT